MLRAREAAISILEDRGGASRVSDTVSRMEPRDRALVQMLVSGVTKQRMLLDHMIEAFCSRPVSRVSTRVLNVIRMGLFEMVFSRTPAYAAIDSAVGCLHGKGERAFANGVLRALSRNAGHIDLPDVDASPALYASLRYSHPAWIAELFVRRFSLSGALRLCSWDNAPPRLTLRVNSMRARPAEVLAGLEDAGVQARQGLVPGSINLLEGVSIPALPGFREGRFVVQDEGATVISMALYPQPGESVWDVCAAPGGKTSHIAEMMGDSGEVLATDVDPGRIDMVRQTVSRLGISIVEAAVADAGTRGGPAAGRMFDRVLVDAPCSGLGVLGRNADLRWNRRAGDIGPMASRQARILQAACDRLKPGGTVVYSTCTLTEQENERVWAGALARNPDLVPEDPAETLGEEARRLVAGAPFAGAGYRYLLPHISGTDGFFVAKARKRG